MLFGLKTLLSDMAFLLLYLIYTYSSQTLIKLPTVLLQPAGSDMRKPHRIGNAVVNLEDFPQQRLISPSGQTRIVLLPASNWKFP